MSNKTRLIVEGRETEERVRLALQQINIIQGYTLNRGESNISSAADQYNIRVYYKQRRE